MSDGDLEGLNSVSWPGDPPGGGVEGHQYVNPQEPGMNTNYPGGTPPGPGNPETNPVIYANPVPDRPYQPGPVTLQPIVNKPQPVNVMPTMNQGHKGFAQALLQGPRGVVRQIPNQQQRGFQRPNNAGVFAVRSLRWR